MKPSSFRRKFLKENLGLKKVNDLVFYNLKNKKL